MRILIVSPYFPPQHAVSSLRVHAFASAWAAAGEEVTVLTTRKRPDQGNLDVTPGPYDVVELPYRVPRFLEALRRTDRTWTAGSPGGGGGRPGPLLRAVRNVRSRTGVFSSLRMPDLTDTWVAPALDWCRRQPPWDVVVSSSGPYTAHLVALGVKRAGGAGFWVTDYRDLWTQNHMARGLFPFTLRERRLERHVLAEADHVVTVSPALAERLQRRCRRVVEVVFNGYTPTEESAIPPESCFPDDGRVRLVYTGTLYPAGQDPRVLLRGLRLVQERHPDLGERLRLVVAGARDASWDDLAADIGVAAMIERRGLVSRTEALRLQRDADGLVVVAWKSPQEGVLTGKVFEYLPWSAPILVVGGRPGDPIAALVRETGRGAHFMDAGPLADALAALARGDDGPAGTPDRALIERYRRDRQALRLLETIRVAGAGGDGGADRAAPPVAAHAPSVP